MTISPLFLWGFFGGWIAALVTLVHRTRMDERENAARLADQYRVAYLDQFEPNATQAQCSVNMAATDLAERIRRGERAPMPPEQR